MRRASSIVVALLAGSLVLVVVPMISRAHGTSSMSGAEPPVRIPSQVAWTDDTISAASNGDALRGLLISRRCDRCHGEEGFSPNPTMPNLAGMDRLVIWKQLEDFRDNKRNSILMQPIAASLTRRDSADLAAYYSLLPNSQDPQDNRSFPQRAPDNAHMAMAIRLVTLGDGERGVPPCAGCHGPVAHVRGAPSLATQNGAYILNQLEAFSARLRGNDINMPMRTVAARLTEDEKQALADYYGSGRGTLTVEMVNH